MPEPQSHKNHTRFHPAFHFFVAPLLILNLGASVYVTLRHWPSHAPIHLWWIVMSFVLLMMAGLSRGNALKAQDRIIRLEERLRLAALLSGPELAASHQLTEPQLIALRFASDAELPTLVHRTLADHLTPAQIKQSITNWRPDYFRV